jgi:dCMP deaminase
MSKKNKSKTVKRQDYISWDEYFMGIALFSAFRSKDPNTQLGACIADSQNKIVGIGYNGMPRGCSDDQFPWSRKGKYLETKYPFVVHAELNAILNSVGHNLESCKIYIPLHPCNECAKAIIQSGIKEVIYLSDKYADTDAVKASKILLKKAGVKTRELKTKRKPLIISFDASKI